VAPVAADGKTTSRHGTSGLRLGYGWALAAATRKIAELDMAAVGRTSSPGPDSLTLAFSAYPD
jgi:hypothetical protein